MDKTEQAKDSEQEMMVVYKQPYGIISDDLRMEMEPTLVREPGGIGGKEMATEMEKDKKLITDGTVDDDLRMVRREIEEKKEETGSSRRRDDEHPYKDLHDMYLAAKNGDLDDFVRILRRVSTAASVRIPHSQFPGGNTLLHVAAKHGNKDIVRFMAGNNPSLVLAKNVIGDTALHLAAKVGDEEMARALVEIQRGLLREENEMGNTALHEALLNGWESIARFLIQQDPELSYHLNSNRESAIYLASKAGFLGCVSSMLALCTDERRLYEVFKYKSPIQAAIETKQRDILEVMFSANPRLIQMIDDEKRNPLHLAAISGHLEEARYLLSKCALNATRMDKDGALPIHWAAFEGHVDIVSLLLQDFPDAGDLLLANGGNILHAAAEGGRYNVFSFVLKNPRLEHLINMKDIYGNTPLHVACWFYHPKIVSTLTWDKRVDIKAVNKAGLTALDVCENQVWENPQLRQRLTWAALRAASVPRQLSNGKASGRIKSFDMSKVNDRVNTLLLVATLVATVTYAAGFTMPGGYISSGPGTDSGMATMWRGTGFHVFVLCDTMAMYSSIVVVTTLIWAQLGDATLVLVALRFSVPLLGIALIMMSMAFTAGVIIVVIKLMWLQIVVLAMAISFIIFLLLLLLPLCAPISSRSRILRYLSYYPFLLLIHISSSEPIHK